MENQHSLLSRFVKMILLWYKTNAAFYFCSSRFQKGFTPLHVAAKYGSLDVAKLLLQRRAAADSAGKVKVFNVCLFLACNLVKLETWEVAVSRYFFSVFWNINIIVETMPETWCRCLSMTCPHTAIPILKVFKQAVSQTCVGITTGSKNFCILRRILAILCNNSYMAF